MCSGLSFFICAELQAHDPKTAIATRTAWNIGALVNVASIRASVAFCALITARETNCQQTILERFSLRKISHGVYPERIEPVRDDKRNVIPSKATDPSVMIIGRE